MADFDFSHAYVDGVLVATPVGEVNSVNARELRQELLLHISELREGVIVRLDLVTRLDPAGVVTLVSGFLQASARGLPFALAAPSRPAAQVLYAGTVPNILRVYDSLRDALEAVAGWSARDAEPVPMMPANQLTRVPAQRATSRRAPTVHVPAS